MEKWRLGLMVLVVLALAWSGVTPYDRTTWYLEVFPVLVVLPLIWWQRQRYPLTSLLFVGVMLHCLVLMYGGAYTYARAPLGDWLAQWFSLDRNPYDKIGHFFQGLIPALACREILMRGAYVQGRRMLNFLTGCVVLAVSASYELIEWGAAVALGQGADEFLGTQGYQWDTQADMGFALLGAIATIVFLSRWHDRQLKHYGRSAD